jgi:hypothetical protein
MADARLRFHDYRSAIRAKDQVSTFRWRQPAFDYYQSRPYETQQTCVKRKSTMLIARWGARILSNSNCASPHRVLQRWMSIGCAHRYRRVSFIERKGGLFKSDEVMFEQSHWEPSY